MQIEITGVTPIVVEGKYPKMTVDYVRDGSAKSNKIVGLGKTKDVMNILKDAKGGDVFDIELEKKGDYYNWVAATKVQGASGATAAAKTSYQAKSTYETPEERAKRQVYIVRQSSISNSIEYLNAQGKKFTVEDVQDVAQQFVDFVFQTERLAKATKLAEKGAAAATTQGELDDDIPF